MPAKLLQSASFATNAVSEPMPGFIPLSFNVPVTARDVLALVLRETLFDLPYGMQGISWAIGPDTYKGGSVVVKDPDWTPKPTTDFSIRTFVRPK
jgi:hypothetical protein